MGKVFMFNIDEKKTLIIKIICVSLNLQYEIVASDKFGCKMESIVGFSDDISSTGESFDEEMLYLAGFDPTALNRFLSQLRHKRANVTLKAAMTETNLKYTAAELYKEIAAEHISMQSGNGIQN